MISIAYLFPKVLVEFSLNQMFTILDVSVREMLIDRISVSQEVLNIDF